MKGGAPGVLGVASLVLTAVAISPFPVPVAGPEFTCKVYALAHDFALNIQPNLTTKQVGQVFDALRLHDCNYSTTTSNYSATTVSKRLRENAPAAAAVLYVSPEGSDSNAGTLDSPLKNVFAAVSRLRSTRNKDQTEHATIILRAGTHFLPDTLTLQPQDSNLTIESFPGETATLSAGVLLPNLWKPYKVTPAGPPKMSLLNDTNLVAACAHFSDPSNLCPYYGLTNDAAGCSSACLSSPACIAFTWHDPNQPPVDKQWSNQCYFVKQGAPSSVMAQTLHVSGRKILSPPQNVFVAAFEAPLSFTGLRVAGARATRARWPNADPERDLYPTGWETSPATWIKPKMAGPASDVVVSQPNRSELGPCESTSGYCYYSTAVGGNCAAMGYEPPSGYWCSSNPTRGSEYTSRAPSGMVYDASAFEGRTWSSFEANHTATVTAFREGAWFSYTWAVDAYDPVERKMEWTWGGFQGAEGCDKAQDWFVENILEELDAPNEWYADRHAHLLYYFYNGTGAPPADLVVVATNLTELVHIEGQYDGKTFTPVTDVVLSNLKFSDSALTLLAPHGLPSDGGGDWAIARTAAVFLQTTERLVIENCVFERLDGTGLMLSGYNRNTTIASNEFTLIGESAIVSWGFTRDFPTASRPVPIPNGQGPDATDGNHPQGTLISSNFIHELGIFQKQSSCYFQAQTQGTRLIQNICFNGPRAGINFNDGMGGGNLLDGNLVFNMVRETQDHGTFNSWDRQPFLVQRDGKQTYIPLSNEITRNFMINDYNPQEAIDNDDGSAYYETHHNFFPFSDGGLKNDFGGHDNHHHHNLYYNSGTCMGVCGQKPGHEDYFYNNTCVLHKNNPDYAMFGAGVGGPALPVMYNNAVYTLDGKATENGKSIQTWQSQGHDLGTTVSVIPDDQYLLDLARSLLKMH